MRESNKNKNSIEAILFDLDGVIINSFESWYQAFNAMLRQFGKVEMSREEFKRRCWGPDLGHNLTALDLDDKAAAYCLHQQMGFIPRINLFPGVKEVLNGAKEKYKYKVGLVTNTPKENTYRILEHFSILMYFDTVVTGDDVKKGKPDPEIVITACERLNVNPKNTILVGDTKSDYLAGKSAGCTVIIMGIGWGVNGDARIESFHDFFTILDELK
jgi:phosphoglycolate phosphatase